VTERFDAIVVGAGLAGMLTALELRPLRVALISYRSLGEATSSAWAQGGIAAAVGDDDSPARHAADTIAAGAGLVERRVAARLAADAPQAIERVAALGVRFDRDGDRYALSREAAHSRRRVLRAGGDATGAELMRAIERAVRESAAIVAFEGVSARDVLLAGGRVRGLIVRRADGPLATLAAPAVVLATGGLGGLYRFTTNPRSSRGSGIAIAARGGARLADLEFVQFHPTALEVPSDPLPLITEALRGEGATLIDDAGARIMTGVDPAGELAPRDVVARRVFAVRQGGGRVWLDARGLGAVDVQKRFPTVFAACARYGIDPRHAPIPVVAAAHYHMGGIAVDMTGRSSVAGLYACGEVAATGVHGANRLASNSLLEAVIYPERIARDIRSRRGAGSATVAVGPIRADAPAVAGFPDEWRALRETMYAGIGVERDAESITRALAVLHPLATESPSEDVRDAALVGTLVAQAALRRRESRGSHVRTDFPQVASGDAARSFSYLANAAGFARSA